MKHLILSFFLILISFPAMAQEKAKESAYERVMRTGIIRCGYFDWMPLFHTDTATGKRSGIFKDVAEEIARVSGLKIEWTAEIPFAQIVTDLNSGKIDALCGGVWPSAARARHIRFTGPVFFLPMHIYKKAGDGRFDGKPGDINQPDVTIVTIDGEMSAEIRNSDFPRSGLVSLPQLSGSASDLLMTVASGKGDITFTDAVQGQEFMNANPGKVEAVTFDAPLRVMSNAIAVGGNEERLQYFLDESLRELHNSGIIDKILAGYDGRYPGILMRVRPSYERMKR
jgi:ABC-type amino acid transport substrate-binding protein